MSNISNKGLFKIAITLAELVEDNKNVSATLKRFKHQQKASEAYWLEVGKRNNELEALNQKLEKQLHELCDVRDENDRIDTVNVRLASENDELKDENERLNSANDRLDAEIDQLKLELSDRPVIDVEIGRLRDQVEKLSDENKRLEYTVKILNKNVSDSQAEFDKLLDTNNKLISELQRLETDHHREKASFVEKHQHYANENFRLGQLSGELIKENRRLKEDYDKLLVQAKHFEDGNVRGGAELITLNKKLFELKEENLRLKNRVTFLEEYQKNTLCFPDTQIPEPKSIETPPTEKEPEPKP